MTSLNEMLQAAIEAKQTVRAIEREPDGTIRLVLTEGGSAAPMSDALAEARARRAAKGDRNVDRDKAAG